MFRSIYYGLVLVVYCIKPIYTELLNHKNRYRVSDEYCLLTKDKLISNN